MKIYFCLVALYCSFVLAQLDDPTLERAFVEGLHRNGTKELTNITAAIAQLEHNGSGHLTTILKHHVETLKQYLSYIQVRFLDINPILIQAHLVDAMVVDMIFLGGQITNEIEISHQIEKKFQHKSNNLTQEELINQGEDAIEYAKLSLLLHRNSREYSLIEREAKDVEDIVKHLQSRSLNETQLNVQAQVLTQYKMSLQVLKEKAKWRLPCEHGCHPTNGSVHLLQLTDPIVVQNTVKFLHSIEVMFQGDINQSMTTQSRMEKEGHGNLTSALAFQITQKKQLLANIEKQFSEPEQVFTQHYIQVILENITRLINRIKEESQIVDDMLRKSNTGRNETNHQLLNRANLILKMSREFISKHKHSVEIPEIENEVANIEPLIGVLNQVKENEDQALNHKVEQQLDRYQKTLIQLMEQANQK